MDIIAGGGIRRDRVIGHNSRQFDFFLNLDEKEKAEAHRKKMRSRLCQIIRRKYTHVTHNRKRFKKVKKVENQTILGARSEIMEMILNHLGVEHLKVCRMVCKSWNQEACRALRKKSIVELTEPKICRDFHRLVNNGRILQLPHPFGQLSLSILVRRIAGFETPIHLLKKYQLRVGRLKYGSFEIPMRIWPPPSPDSFLRCFHFLQDSAPTLTHLCSSFWELPPKLQESYLSLQFPNLETLQLVPSDSFLNRPQEEELLRRIVATSPKLVNLSTSDFLTNETAKLLNLKNIRKLDYVLHTTDGSLEPLLTLASACHYLKTLSMVLLPLEDESQLPTVKEIIARVGSSLEVLVLGTSEELKLKGDFFPDSPKLHTLYISTFYPYQLNLTSLTSLKSLDFEDINFSASPKSSTSTGIRVYPHVKEIKAGDGSIKKSGFERLFKLFPNAVSWEIPSKSLPVFRSAMSTATRKQIKKMKLNFWCRETTKALKDLLYLPDLEELDLLNLQALSEADVDIICKLTNLRILRISDDALERDKTMPSVFQNILTYARKLVHLEKIVFLNLRSKDNLQLVERICTQIPSAEFQFEDKSDFACSSSSS